ncbi:hypothetical protein [Sediminibacillus albus]|uniref:Uncharacterized protein n=1 Tax=Sediminibacillus albus TaxID=407036 RepID=A0A1G8WCN8_9BACI|nr:hypothetical protein [Sediminibacillus albus]SDJ76089.1 hypothetical protein SAMN05216243_0710 [Sediminibacillus albus]
MIWVYLSILVLLLVGVAVYYEKWGKQKNNDSTVTIEEEETLNEDYIKHGAHNETEDADKL